MRRLLIPLALIVGTAFVPTVAQGQRPHPEVNCVGTVVWVDYPNASGPGCVMQPGQTLNVRYLPSNMTLSAAHTWCTDRGGVAVSTRWGGVANVCPDVDI